MIYLNQSEILIVGWFDQYGLLYSEFLVSDIESTDEWASFILCLVLFFFFIVM